MAKRFTEQVVWITGGGSGIGRALAFAFAQEGATVAVSGRREDRLAQVVTELRAEGATALAVPCNVTDEDSVRKAVGTVVAELGKLDVAVANAGWSLSGRVESLSAEQWRRQLDVNVVGLATTARYAIPYLKVTGGRLVLVGSITSMLPTPGVGAYVASKFAVRGLGQTLSIELHGSGVSCTTIHPGYVQSEIAQVDNEGVFDAGREDRRPKTMMWTAERAAEVMVDAIAKRKREFVFTGHGKVGAFVGRHWPGLVYLAFTRSRLKRGLGRRSKESS
jgi:NAD(P)-dependent dehydrogenase (short-subunit alcohol dehydrogenase family)